MQNTKSPVPVDVLFVCALGIERQAIVHWLRDLRRIQHPAGTIYDLGTHGSPSTAMNAAVVEVGKGNVLAALETERAINFLRPQYVLFVGVAGGIKDAQIGDVVVASKIYGYESGKQSVGYASRPDVFPSSFRVLHKAKSVLGSGTARQVGGVSYKVHFGPLVAGEKVIVRKNSALGRRIQQTFNDALAVEMEGLGVLLAAYANDTVDAIVIRGVSDLLDNKSDGDDEKRQGAAAANACDVAFAVAIHLERLTRGQSKSPIEYLFYHDTVVYHEVEHTYEFITERVVRNLSDFPLMRDPHYIWCNKFPEDSKRAEQFYASTPLKWEDISFKAWDDSGPLDTSVLNSLGSRIDCHILFERGRHKRFVLPGQTHRYWYSYKYKCAMDGTYYERYVHFPIRELRLELDFPEAVKPQVYGYIRTEVGPNLPLSPEVESLPAAGDRIRFQWMTSDPVHGYSYALAWEHERFQAYE